MEQFITEGDRIYDMRGEYIGTVDRTMASERDYGCDAEIRVVLACGHKERFWNIRHSNEEYINRTITLKTLTT